MPCSRCRWCGGILPPQRILSPWDPGRVRLRRGQSFPPPRRRMRNMGKRWTDPFMKASDRYRVGLRKRRTPQSMVSSRRRNLLSATLQRRHRVPRQSTTPRPSHPVHQYCRVHRSINSCTRNWRAHRAADVGPTPSLTVDPRAAGATGTVRARVLRWASAQTSRMRGSIEGIQHHT